jgi:phage terminase large subunit-like protein
MDRHLQDPNVRFFHSRIFRGGAKTTRLRTFTAKRIAYGLSRTILYIGASEGHASRSIQWLRGQIDRNVPFASTFGLAPGKKWQDVECEIVNSVTGDVCWVLGVGSTSNLRGINFDDYRPDLIIVDDVITDENSATLDQRNKTDTLIFGAIKESLAPRSEEPNAKMVFLQTPLHPDDSSHKIEKDPEWTFQFAPCWTLGTLDNDVEHQDSAWPERYPSPELRASKRSAAASGRLSTWVRENECRIISAEASAFRSSWLIRLPELPAPGSTFNVLAVDPVPPPSDREVAKGLQGKNWESILVAGRGLGNYYVLDYATNRGHEPNWTVWKVFELAQRYRVAFIVVEAVAYQRTLKWLLEQEMRRRQIYYQIRPLDDRRKKYNRIVSTLSGIASQGQLYCHVSHTEFIQQFEQYPVEPDDVIDSAAMALSKLINPALEKLEAGGFQTFEPEPIRLTGHP